jgi:alpha-1,3-rhamnosyl/mannosyltransferase
MSLLIDGRPLQTPSVFRGIGRYVRHIAQAFGRDERARFLFFRGDDDLAGLERKAFSPAPRRLITLSDPFFLPPIFRRLRTTCYHSTAYALPRRAGGVRLLLTVFDLTLLKFPRQASWRHRQVFQRIVASARRADLVLAISRRTADDLSERGAIAPERLRVVPPMIDPGLVRENAVKPALALPGEYLLYAGGADASKNLETLLRAVSLLRLPLVVAGAINVRRASELLAMLPPADRRLATFAGHLPDPQLAHLYAHAAAFVLPSLNEGFGYPPLEALQCGTPAVVSRAGSLPEVLEDAAIFVDDPLDPGEWAGRIAGLLNDPGTKRELLARGAKLLERYSPAAFRKNLERAYFPSE